MHRLKELSALSHPIALDPEGLPICRPVKEDVDVTKKQDTQAVRLTIRLEDPTAPNAARLMLDLDGGARGMVEADYIQEATLGPDPAPTGFGPGIPDTRPEPFDGLEGHVWARHDGRAAAGSLGPRVVKEPQV